MDLGSLAFDMQIAINGMIDWAITQDIFYVCNILLGVDLSDVLARGSGYF